ncbi:hypothetical protein [Ottowia sp.]|uniref:hypothetical protein n=1 Tax=Ottowia sp. TaxID=1898956 RepID=UPI0025DEACFC|nr:hypothetical protein [Ottowia sp.]MBK6616343.1 hypothetical protein [Ottowia sp.]
MTSALFGCLYFAAGAAGAMRGVGGGRFVAGGPSLGSGVLRGWGLIVNPRDGTYSVTADRVVDEDGSFCDHCWVEVGPPFDVTVVDLATGYIGPRVVNSDMIVYHPVGSLRASIRRRHGASLDAVTKLGGKDAFLRAFFSNQL